MCRRAAEQGAEADEGLLSSRSALELRSLAPVLARQEAGREGVMPAGDRAQTWFREVIAELRASWRPGLPWRASSRFGRRSSGRWMRLWPPITELAQGPGPDVPIVVVKCGRSSPSARFCLRLGVLGSSQRIRSVNWTRHGPSIALFISSTCSAAKTRRRAPIFTHSSPRRGRGA